MTTILRLPAVKARTGLSRSSIYAFIANGRFPPAISLGARAVGWSSESIDAWVSARIEQSRGKKGEVTAAVHVTPNTSDAPATELHPIARFGAPGLHLRPGLNSARLQR
jgi:prophage regulatory protein